MDYFLLCPFIVKFCHPDYDLKSIVWKDVEKLKTRRKFIYLLANISLSTVNY